MSYLYVKRLRLENALRTASAQTWAQLGRSMVWTTQCPLKINKSGLTNWVKISWAKFIRVNIQRWVHAPNTRPICELYFQYTRVLIFLLMRFLSIFYRIEHCADVCVQVRLFSISFVRLVSVCMCCCCIFFICFIRWSFILHLSTLECRCAYVCVYLCDCHCCCRSLPSPVFLCFFSSSSSTSSSSSCSFGRVLAVASECVVRSAIFMYGNWFTLNRYQRRCECCCVHVCTHCHMSVFNGYRCIFVSYFYKSYSATDSNQCTLVCDQILLLTLLYYLPAARLLAHALARSLSLHNCVTAACLPAACFTCTYIHICCHRYIGRSFVLFCLGTVRLCSNIYYCYYDSCLIRFRLSVPFHIQAACVVHVEYRQQWIQCYEFDLVNCWLHAKQHRMLYGRILFYSLILISGSSTSIRTMYGVCHRFHWIITEMKKIWKIYTFKQSEDKEKKAPKQTYKTKQKKR